MKQRELRAFTLLLVLISLVVFTKPLISYFERPVDLNPNWEYDVQNSPVSNYKISKLDSIKAFKNSGNVVKTSRYKAKKKIAYASVSINAADSAELCSIPGVGSFTASQILNYRTKLGGFVSLDQLKEVYSLDKRFSDIKPYFFVDSSLIIPAIDLNNGSFKSLVKHPYIRYDQAKAIMKLRKILPMLNTKDLLLDTTWSLPQLKYLDHYIVK
jgi:hypothetical protein